MQIKKQDFIKIKENLWEIPKSFRKEMNVPARLYASDRMLDNILKDRSINQLINITSLPGIESYSIGMPDTHEGYGFPIGGVAAFNEKNGIISPGGIGYDINCGVRLLRTSIKINELKKFIEDIGQEFFRAVPCGVGKSGYFHFKAKDLDKILKNGVKEMAELGFAQEHDIKHIEAKGKIDQAETILVSKHAKERGQKQLGTLGAGNHFIEIEYVEKVYDQTEAAKNNIFEGQIVILIHTGSRGLGHQVATDYIKILRAAAQKYKIKLVDHELVCAPFSSEEGQRYFSAMAAAANYAFANRQLITYQLRKVWKSYFGKDSSNLDLVYDISHNIARKERFEYGDISKELIVHRKGATRSFPGSPVIIPGSMGTGSWLMVGHENALKESFGSTSHGAGRTMSRKQARRTIKSNELTQRLQKQGIKVITNSFSGLVEEAPEAYKDVDNIVQIISKANIAKKVACCRPLLVIKG
jgi:tRNA-splicing ligase RtcB (3'-phosphate/5'-hydroxy nucleic acid ligase)